MGASSSFLIRNKYSSSEKYLLIVSNDDGYIEDINKEFEIKTGINKSSLIGKFIGSVMNPFTSYLHKNFHIPKIQNFSKKNINVDIMDTKTKPFIIFDAKGKILRYSLEVKLILGKIYMKFFDLTLSDNSHMYTSLSKTLNSTSMQQKFKESQRKMIIISLDFVNSTNLLVNKGVEESININEKFHKIVIDIIESYFYPYIYIHEILGDCFTFILNADWTYNIERFCSSLCLYFMNMLYKKTKNLIPIRLGVTYDTIHYGFIDHNLRFFGESINLAARFEHECTENNIVCNEAFINKIESEGLIEFETVSIHKELKGFGDTNCFFISQNTINVIGDNIFESHLY